MGNYIAIRTPKDVPSDKLLNAGLYDSDGLIRVQSSDSPTSGYANLAGAGSTPTIDLVANQETYEAYDPDGTSAKFYRTRFENLAGTRASDWKSAIPTRYG